MEKVLRTFSTDENLRFSRELCSRDRVPAIQQAVFPQPANRLHDYEAGWLTLLIEIGVATKQEARDAMCGVPQAAIDEFNERRERRRAARDQRRKREAG